MASTVYFSTVLLITCFAQISESAFKDVLQSNFEQNDFPLPRSRVRREPKQFNFPQPIYDNHKYYNKETLHGAVDDHWIPLEEDKKHLKLSNSPGGYDKVNATFEFQFYGHTIKRVYLSTAGVLSMSGFEEDETPPTHYIAPYLGHFNPNLHLDSAILFESQGNMFITEWRDVRLREVPSLGSFTFEAIVHSDGTVKFLYKKLPQAEIRQRNVTVDSNLIIGLVGSINIEIAGIKISAYYQAEFVNPNDLQQGDVIIFKPVETCNLAKNCHTCVSRKLEFDCKWCDLTRTCYDSLDQHTELFLASGCVSEITANCSGYQMETTTEPPPASSSSSVITIVIVVIVLVVIAMVGGLFLYAYRHPGSASGRWLIEHRPSLWKSLIFGRKEVKEGQEQPKY